MTKWSKLDTTWTGVSLDTLLAGVETEAEHVTAWSDGGYTTNMPLDDLTGGRAWVVHGYDGSRWRPSTAARRGCSSRTSTSGRARSGCGGLTLTLDDEPGFWEAAGYHNYGDPWREQRYWND